MEEQIITEEKMKKSSFTAKTEFDYRKLMFREPYLLDLQLEEEKEELKLFYQLSSYKPFAGIRNEDRLTILAVLMNLESLQEGLYSYHFSLQPENLYYDKNRLIRAKIRDVYAAGQGFEAAEFLVNYQALCGFALQNRYSYEDIRQGGKRLAGKDPLINQIQEAAALQDIRNILQKEYERVESERKEKQRLIGKNTYRKMTVAIVILAVLCLGAAAYCGYTLIRENPYQNAVIAADNAYIETDYVACIDALKNIKVSDLKLSQKYILANSYVRSENLSQEQKNNILANLSIKDAPVRLEYWIYLGRGETEQAVDIAMQQSDDQLLLYSYMKQKASIESDTELSGAEKTQLLNDINDKMEPLIEQYDTAEEN